MKHRFLAVSLFVFASLSLSAQQWSEPTTDTFTTTRKVGIGTTTAPAKQLEVIGEAAFSSFLTAGEVVIQPSSGLLRGRVHMANPQWVGLTLNARVNSAWELDDTSYPGWAVKLDARNGYDTFAVMRVPPGPNPHTDEKQLLQIHGNNGFVGIGLPLTSVPQYKLHIADNVNTRTLVQIDNGNAGVDAAAGFRASANLAQLFLIAHSSNRNVSRWGYTTLGGWNELLGISGNGTIVGSQTAVPLILGTNSASRVHITGDGNIGVNTNFPSDGLHLYNKNIFVQSDAPVGTPSHAHIGIGAKGANGATYFYRWYVASSVGGSGLVPNANELYEYPDADSVACCKLRIRILPSNNQVVQPVVIDGAGRLGLGGTLGPAHTLDVNGDARIRTNLYVDGNIGAKYQDLAEWVPATEDLTPGTVVILNPASINEVMPSARAYDTRVAGVVSEQPGIILGEAGSQKEQIATTGRVKVRVDASKGAIGVGDLLVTSDVPGTAMKSQPLDLGGVAIHRPGTIVGKALEPLAGGTGEILVLLSLQ